MTSIELPESLEKDLIALSKKLNQSVEDLVNKALETYLEDVEDYYVALGRLEKHKQDKGRTYSLDEIGKELGLDEKEEL